MTSFFSLNPQASLTATPIPTSTFPNCQSWIGNLHSFSNCSFLRLANSTHKSQQARLQQYQHFCTQINYATSESTLLLFTAYLGRIDLSHSTIKVYLSAICNLHIVNGRHLSFSNQLTPRLQQVLCGIKMEQTHHTVPRTRLPITIQIIKLL